MKDGFERKILICGGGTAGHVYPAVAIIEYIQKNYPTAKLLYVGIEKGMEGKFISELRVDFKKIKILGLSNGSSFFEKLWNFLKFLFFLKIGFFQSVKIILKFNPDFILGMGGYVCAPVLLASIILRRKFVLHEQNYIPGRVNRLFSRFAKRIFISFDETKKFLNVGSEKVIFAGNPVRERIRNFSLENPDYKKWGLNEHRFSIVVFGGSLGADKINNVTLGLYTYFRNCEDIQILLICGERFYKDLERKMDNIRNGKDKLIFRIFPYIHEMDEIYRIADLVVCRAGANTIAELAFCNIPAILVPYPWAVENHQYYNAEFLARNGKGILVLDKELSEKILEEKLEELLADGRKKYMEMKEKKIMDFQKVNGAKIITDFLMGS